MAEWQCIMLCLHSFKKVGSFSMMYTLPTAFSQNVQIIVVFTHRPCGFFDLASIILEILVTTNVKILVLKMKIWIWALYVIFYKSINFIRWLNRGILSFFKQEFQIWFNMDMVVIVKNTKFKLNISETIFARPKYAGT